MTIREAPFTPDEVLSLQAFQVCGCFHEFTCPNRSAENHRGTGGLWPTVRGWICPYCSYTQSWAHDFMCAGGDHQKSAEVIRGMFKKGE
jgi:hypothetical protein